MAMNTTGSFSYPPRGLSRCEAARYIGVATTTFDRLVTTGRMPKPKQVDGQLIWDRFTLDAAFTALPTSGEIGAAQIPALTAKANSKVAPPPEVYTTKSLAEHWACSERHVRNLCDAGKLASFKAGGKLIRIRRDEVERFEISQAYQTAEKMTHEH